MGEVKIIVPAHMHVVVDGTPITGEFAQQKDKVAPEIGPDSPPCGCVGWRSWAR